MSKHAIYDLRQSGGGLQMTSTTPLAGIGSTGWEPFVGTFSALLSGSSTGITGVVEISQTDPAVSASPVTLDTLSGAAPLRQTYTLQGLFWARVRVTATSGAVGVGLSGPSSMLSAPLPGVVTAPVVSGSPTVGQTLSCTQGVWSNSPTSYAYQWFRGPIAIAGATAATYLATTADIDFNLRCQVSATNDDGTGSVKAEASARVQAAPIVLGAIGPSTATVPTGALPGTVIATITGKTPLSYLYYAPNDGRVVLVGDDVNGFKLVVGLKGVASGFTVSFEEDHPLASNSGRISTMALSVSGGAATVPAAPTLGAPIAGNGQLSVPFTDGRNGGAAITAHKVYSGASAGALTLLGTFSTGTPFVDTGLTNGTARFYAMSAVNSIGEGAQSAVVSGTPGLLNAVQTLSGLSQALATTSLTPFATSASPPNQQVVLNPAQTYQAWLGTGAALTDSAVYLLTQTMSSTQRAAFLQEAFGTNGFSTLRICIGSADFRRDANFYTYDDNGGTADPTLANFSIQKDVDAGITGVLQQILAINPNVKIFAMPWSPPAWMKSPASLIGGAFVENTTNFNTMAQYFVKFVQGYASLGIPIAYVAPQNEPAHSTAYPSCTYTAGGLNSFAKAIISAFAGAGITTKVLAGDDNWSQAGTFINAQLGDSTTLAGLDGVSFHGYAGDASYQISIMGSYPTKSIHCTEYRTLLAASLDTDQADIAANWLINSIRNRANSVTMWNLCLDPSGNPTQNSTGRRGVVTVNPDGSVTRNPEYYVLSHIGKFVQRGAQRIASTSVGVGSSGTDVQTAAFLNPDGSTVAFLWNGSSSDKPVSLTDGYSGQTTSFTVTARSMMTVIFARLSVKAALANVSAPAATAIVGTAYSYTPAISGGVPAYTFALTGTLPSGLSFSTATGAISGTPTASGTASGLAVVATDAVGASVSTGTFSIAVAASAALSISGTPSAAANVGAAYSFTPTAAGGTAPYTFALTGTVPPGLSFSTSTGAITGTPTAAGTASGLNITVTDSVGATASLGAFSIAVTAVAALAIDSVTTHSSGGNAVSHTWSHTVGGSANLLVVTLGIGVPSGAGVDYPSATSVTAGGVAMTRQVRALGSASPGTDRAAEIWVLQNPPTGAVTIVANTPQGSGASAPSSVGTSISFNNAQATPFGTGVTALSTAGGVTSLTANPTTTSPGITITVAAARSTAALTTSGAETSISSILSGTNTAVITTRRANGNPGPVTESWTTADAGALASIPVLSA